MFFLDSPHLVVLQKPASSDENPIGGEPSPTVLARLDLSWGSSAFQTSGFGLRPWSNLKEMGMMGDTRIGKVVADWPRTAHDR